ncbi:squalene/phytoene synthase family protein [Streptomyces sp. NBC_01197]|uniref:squalene/phytoene synthase family protein n=1 Tax=Streptomyces sp. NBC_01197 TaxID=2903768 RepID=UPI002E15609E|nr:squalene/phytoene synthase family protein [Streptomyces sp. NBC_01197]
MQPLLLTGYQRTLTQAEIPCPLHAAYTAAAAYMARRERAVTLTVRHLAPQELQPHLLAVLAFGCVSDDTADDNPGNTTTVNAWADHALKALDGGPTTHPILRALVHTLLVRKTPDHWVRLFITRTRDETHFTGFDTDDDFTACVRAYTYPLLMMSVDVQYPGGADARQAEEWFPLAEAFHRIDSLCDLADDLGQGRLTIPRQDLADHDLTPCDLTFSGPSPGQVREVLRLMCRRAWTAHEASLACAEAAAPAYRRMALAAWDLQGRRLARCETAGLQLLRRVVHVGKTDAVRVAVSDAIRQWNSR